LAIAGATGTMHPFELSSVDDPATARFFVSNFLDTA
jgi:hypothetical protein